MTAEGDALRALADQVDSTIQQLRGSMVELTAERDALEVANEELTGELTETQIELIRVQTALEACQQDHEPDPDPEPTPKALVGMSAPADQWDARLREVGPVQARRLFGQLASSAARIAQAKDEITAGRLPVLSFKVPGDDWAGAAAGRYDAMFRDLATKLGALPGKVFVAVHHEPGNDGTPANFVAMQLHVLPILAAPANVEVGVILNSQWGKPVQTDADIAQWVPKAVLDLCDVVAADIYQGGTNAKPLEGAGPKIRRMSEWATRVGVKRLGIGEYNCLTAAELRDAGDAILSDPRFAWALVFNSSENNREGVNWVLTGDRLAAFKETLAASRK